MTKAFRFTHVPAAVARAAGVGRRAADAVNLLDDRDRQLEDHLAGVDSRIPVPATTVVSETSFAQSASAGAGTAYARATHTHGTPDHGYANHSAVPAASVYRNTNFVTNDAVEHTIASYTGTRWDNASMWDSGGLLTAPATGLYLVAGQVFWESNAVGQRVLHLVINNTLTIIDDHQMAGVGLTGPGMSCARAYRLTAGDNLRMKVLQQSGGNLNVIGNNNYGMEMSMTWLSA